MSRNSFYVFRRLTLWIQCELTFFFSGFHFYKGILFFGTVLDLQKNWKDSTASSWITCTQISIFISHISVSRSVMPDSLRPHGLQSTRLLCPWDPPGKDTGVVCHFLLQGIFPTQGQNLGLLHYRQILYHLSYQGSTGYNDSCYLLGWLYHEWRTSLVAQW